MNKKTLVLLFVFAQMGQAGTLDCYNKKKQLILHHEHSDGGAAIVATTTLFLEGDTLISQTPQKEDDILLAAYHFKGKKKGVVTTHSNPNFREERFTRRLVVTLNAASELVFDGWVHCKEATYVGPPRP